LQVLSNNEVSAPADTTTIKIPDRDSVHGLAQPDVPVAIPVTVTADGKAHAGVPMDIPEDTLPDGGSIWDGGVNHSTSVHITNIMTSGGGVSSLVEVVGYPALHLPVLASSFEVGLQPLNLHRRISDLVRKQNARAQREHVRGVAAAGDPFAAATVHGPAGSDSVDGVAAGAADFPDAYVADAPESLISPTMMRPYTPNLRTMVKRQFELREVVMMLAFLPPLLRVMLRFTTCLMVKAILPALGLRLVVLVLWPLVSSPLTEVLTSTVRTFGGSTSGWKTAVMQLNFGLPREKLVL
jgi:hypothetical protein